MKDRTLPAWMDAPCSGRKLEVVAQRHALSAGPTGKAQDNVRIRSNLYHSYSSVIFWPPIVLARQKPRQIILFLFWRSVANDAGADHFKPHRCRRRCAHPCTFRCKDVSLHLAPPCSNPRPCWKAICQNAVQMVRSEAALLE
jgi:hypothetical protein